MKRYEFRAYLSIPAENEAEARSMIQAHIDLGHVIGIGGETDEAAGEVIEDDEEDVDYWNMSAAVLAAAWHEVDAADYSDDSNGEKVERLNFVEDAILQRTGAPKDASGDDPRWQTVIRRWAFANTWRCGVAKENP